MVPFFSCQATVAMFFMIAGTVMNVSSTDPQSMYAACAVNNPETEYYCCEMSETKKSVFTKFYRPNGEEFAKYYEEGWKKPRQVNFPDAFYRPTSPEFEYGDPKNMCRIKTIVRDGEPIDTLQCTFEPKKGDTFEQNTTGLAEDSQDFNVYWTSSSNPRNNNASFPIGAICTRLDAKDQAAREKCVSFGGGMTFLFNTFTEGPLVFIYFMFGLLAGVMALWAIVRSSQARREGSENTASSLEDGKKNLLNNRIGLTTPLSSHDSLAMRQSEVNLRQNVEDIIQTGYSDCFFGKSTFAFFILMTIGVNVLAIVVILDNNDKFKQRLFNPFEVLINVFIILWSICAIWLGIVVVYQEKIVNFFRIPDTLDRSDRVRMFKPENTEILLADRSGVSQFVARVENFLFPSKVQGYEKTVKVFTSMDGSRYLEFQHLRYTYDEFSGRFVPGSVMMGDTYAQISEEAIGLSNAEHLRRLDTVGRNAIEVEMPSILQSLVEEFFCFFYIYQIVCYYSWYFTGYWNVAFLNTIVIIGAATINIINKRSMMCNIVQMTHYECEVTVKRDGSWKTVKSSDIVPGDLVRVDENWLIPCDMIIVKGSTVCDESMLTGESMPVQKFPIPSDSSDAYVVESSGKKYTLFAGTKALSSGRNEEILAVVQSTGAHTSRGQLIQSILFPVPMRFKYDEHLKVVVVFLFLWGIVAAYLAMYFLIGNAGLGNKMFAFVYGMFMFSAVLSPLLPVVITVGQVNAAKRLQKLGVFCLNSQRITLCGKLRVFCFDKTGTITKEGLDFRGCVPIDKNAFVSEVNNVTSKELNSHMKFALASCHAVGSLNGELVGNQVEVKMFKATQWKLIEEEGQLPVVESPEGNDALEVVKRFEFDHHRMSMSVVMRHKTSGKMYVFVKGSYEKMQQLSRTETIPSDYVSHAETLAKNGCYVLGMGMKEITTDLQQSEKELENFLSNRDAVEQNVNLLGLIMFRNELKNDSRESILKLKEGDIRVVMITGDNAMTGCFIARESGMVNANAKVILGDMIANESNEGGAKNLVWKNVDTEETFSLDQIYSMLLKNNNSQDDIELAVTGAAFDYLLKIGELKKLLLNIRIFSRMTPSGKVECVKLHMTAGAVTGMCGDGGNDCGALRIAHVGVALSDAEASVVSPFTSKTKSIASVIDLCREGRCSLATSFGSVKFLIMYGLIGCGLRFTMYSNSVFVAEYGFMFCDGAILVGLSYAITLARPLKKLGKQRPTSSLVGPTTILSMIGQEIIHALFLYFGIRYVMTRSWYCPFNPANVDLVKWWLLQDSNLGTSLWYLVAPQQMIGAITYSLGSKFRLPVWRNYFLMFYFALLFVFMNVIFLGEPNVVSDRFRIASSTNVIGLPDIPLPDSFRWDLFWIVIANMATIVLFEWFVILGPVRHYFRNKYHKDSLTLKL